MLFRNSKADGFLAWVFLVPIWKGIWKFISDLDGDSIGATLFICWAVSIVALLLAGIYYKDKRSDAFDASSFDVINAYDLGTIDKLLDPDKDGRYDDIMVVTTSGHVFTDIDIDYFDSFKINGNVSVIKKSNEKYVDERPDLYNTESRIDQYKSIRYYLMIEGSTYQYRISRDFDAKSIPSRDTYDSIDTYLLSSSTEIKEEKDIIEEEKEIKKYEITGTVHQ